MKLPKRPSARGRGSSRPARSLELILDPATSARLGRVRQRDTSPELIVRKILTALGHRYRIENRGLPGSPDVANRQRGWVIFVHGCFWHSHRGCARATIPKRNREFWVMKFRTNRARDRRSEREAEALGLRVHVVWECETKDTVELAKRLKREIEGGKSQAAPRGRR